MTRDQLVLLGTNSAEEKIMMFLVNWRNRLAGLEPPSKSASWRAGSSAFLKPIPLPMLRRDIADFIGLELATVSRTLTKLKQKNVIRTIARDVFLTEPEPAVPT